MTALNSRVAIAAFGLSVSASVLLPMAASAQPYGRAWGGYYGYTTPWAYGAPYEEDLVPQGYPPRYYYRQGYGPRGAPDGYRREGAVSLHEIERQVGGFGLRLIAAPRHNGRVYLAEAEDRRGQRRRLVFSALDGRLISNTPLATASRPVARKTLEEPAANVPGTRPPAAKTPASKTPAPVPSEAIKAPEPGAAPPPPPAPEPAHAKATTGVPGALRASPVPPAQSIPAPAPATKVEAPPPPVAPTAASEPPPAPRSAVPHVPAAESTPDHASEGSAPVPDAK